MPEINHDHLMSEIKNLKLSDQLRILEEIAALIRRNTRGADQMRSITELRGKGKDIWKNINVKNYLAEERSSWTG
mgnify:FL=1